ncbi:MAG: pyruvate/2-oxoglutarate dehydrogenase complex dihydrolipoamide acyltransferase (E2) component [Bacteroidia bacterium]|jgi:pyruvate/2-oxoglutarate dehydrogenase complex dihydrolipoamide acyltransferase (E2) component
MAADAVRIGKRLPYIHALVELDVTKARIVLKNHRQIAGKRISLTAYLMLCCADAIAEDLKIQRMLDWRSRFIEFSDIDFFMPLENQASESKQLVMRLFRSVNKKDIGEIDKILTRSVNGVAPTLGMAQRMFMKLPWLVRGPVYRFWMQLPSMRKKYFGTVYFSSIMNYSADRTTWGVPIPMHSLGIFIGTVSSKLFQTRAGIEKRDMLQITISVDHRVNNGGDMARFVHRLKYILEKGNLFED